MEPDYWGSQAHPVGLLPPSWFLLYCRVVKTNNLLYYISAKVLNNLEKSIMVVGRACHGVVCHTIIMESFVFLPKQLLWLYNCMQAKSEHNLACHATWEKQQMGVATYQLWSRISATSQETSQLMQLVNNHMHQFKHWTARNLSPRLKTLVQYSSCERKCCSKHQTLLHF